MVAQDNTKQFMLESFLSVTVFPGLLQESSSVMTFFHKVQSKTN